MRQKNIEITAGRMGRHRTRRHRLPPSLDRSRFENHSRRLRHAGPRNRLRPYRSRPWPGRLRSRLALRLAGAGTGGCRRANSLPKPAICKGESVFKADPRIIQKLTEHGALLKEEKLSHSYPHCWRCKKPVIFRATEQWFISMEKNGLRNRRSHAIEEVRWIPPWGKDRIRGMLESRPDWCISRQRSWGVPIPAVYCRKCNQAVLTQELCNHVADDF